MDDLQTDDLLDKFNYICFIKMDEYKYKVQEELTWENVLASSHSKSGTYLHKFFEEIVIPSGYPYFAWNGVVFKVVFKKVK